MQAMHWTKWSWLALAGALVVGAIAWVLFAPEVVALRNSVGH